MVERQLPKLHTGVRFPSPALSLFPLVNDLNKYRWTLSDVLTISSDHLWHQSLKTRINRPRVRSGSPVSTVSEATEGFGGSNGAQKRLTGNWRRDRSEERRVGKECRSRW